VLDISEWEERFSLDHGDRAMPAADQAPRPPGLSLLLMRSFTDGMNDLLRPPIPLRTDAKKVVPESIVSINATLPNEKVVFCCMKFFKHYLLIPLLAKSGFQQPFHPQSM